MVPLSIFPWFPGWFLQVHLTWTPMYMRHPQKSYQGVFSGWVWRLSIISNSRRHSCMEAGYNHVPCRFSNCFFRRYTRHRRMGPNSTKTPHSPHFKSLHPKVELLKGLFSWEHCKKETLCLFVCVCAWTFPIEVKLVLFQHITGTVSSEATSDMGYWIWSIHRIWWTLPWWCWKLVALFGSFVWFFFSSFQAIASTHEIWSGNTLHQGT